MVKVECLNVSNFGHFVARKQKLEGGPYAPPPPPGIGLNTHIVYLSALKSAEEAKGMRVIVAI